MTLPLPDKPRRLVYIGTPDVAVPTLRALVGAGHEIVLVVTRADARRGRGSATTPSPVKVAASELGLEVTHEIDDVLAVQADLGVVVAYGRLIRANVLDALPLVNLHFSLLPRWRGAAPVERALLAGDEVTGVCLMDVVAELDAGDVFARSEVQISDDDSLDSLRARLIAQGTALLLDGLANGFGPPDPQRGEAVYAEKIRSADLQLDWSGSAVQVRRVTSLGGAWTTFRGRRLKVQSVAPAETPEGEALGMPGTVMPGGSGRGPVVAVRDGWLELEEVQPEGKSKMPARAWWNGVQASPNDRLGE